MKLTFAPILTMVIDFVLSIRGVPGECMERVYG